MKYYIIAGEASGDLHGSNLIKALCKEDPAAEFRVWGGDLMAAAGATLAKHYRDLAIMGVWQVLKNMPTILGNFKFCKEDITAFSPDVILLIDYSGFNLRIAKWTHQQGYFNCYYIAPQVWATRAKRAYKIKAFIDKTFVILPFEKEFYQKYNYPVEFVGHPLLDIIQNPTKNNLILTKNKIEKPIIALLPGSRKQEIKAMLPVMLSIVDAFPKYQFVVAAAPSITADFYTNLLGDKPVFLLKNQTYDLLQNSEAALVTSGTATLEAALFGLPQVVCYKANWFLYFIVKMIIKVRYISIVNLIMGKPIVVELIQNNLNSQRLKKELSALLGQQKNRTILLQNYKLLQQKLGGAGASARVAKSVFENAKNRKETNLHHKMQ